LDIDSQQRGYVFIHAKPPWAGLSKTRLAAAVGDEGAASLSKAFLKDIWATVKQLKWARPVILMGYGNREALELDADAEVWMGEKDVDPRASWAFERGLQDAPFVIQLPSDIPGVPARLLDDAYTALQGYDVVVGPDQTDIPYLLGVRRSAREKFGGVSWLDSKSATEFMGKLKAAGVTLTRIGRWFDVDRPEDLDKLHGLLKSGEVTAPETARTLEALGFVPGRRVS
jgi:glycosyltransferase A (GT-A) superfamily protein (DUF2064 family)